MSAICLGCQWLGSTACAETRALSPKTIPTIHQMTVISLIYLSAGTEIAPGGLLHHSNFIFKFLKKKNPINRFS